MSSSIGTKAPLQSRPDGTGSCLARVALHLTVVSVLLAASASGVSAQARDLIDVSRVPRLDLVQVARVGGYDNRDAYVFPRFSAGAVLPTGEIALVDNATRQIRIFGQDGVFRRRFGRSGQGPGEFSSIGGISPISGDRILAWDAVGGSGGRVVLFALDGRHLTTHAMESLDRGALVYLPDGRTPMGGMWSPPTFVGALQDGAIILRQDKPSTVATATLPDGVIPDTARFLLYSVASRSARVLGQIEGDVRIKSSLGTASHYEKKLFPRAILAAVASDRLVFGNNDNAALAIITASGQRPQPWPLVRRARPIPQALVRAAREERAAELDRPSNVATPPGFTGPGPASQTLRERAAESLESHTTFPEFRRLVAAGDGSIWLEDFPLPNAKQVRWYRLSNGVATGWLDLDATSYILAVGSDLIVRIDRDDLGVETAVLLRISKS